MRLADVTVLLESDPQLSQDERQAAVLMARLLVRTAKKRITVGAAGESKYHRSLDGLPLSPVELARIHAVVGALFDALEVAEDTYPVGFELVPDAELGAKLIGGPTELGR